MVSPSKRRVQRYQKSAQWTSGISWLCALFTIILIIIINSAGIGVNENTINGESYAILYFTTPYNEVKSPVSLAYTYHLFPNGVCAKPAGFIDKTVGPYCTYNTPFTRYNLSYVLEKGDVQVKSDLQFSFGNASFPTETAEKAHLDPFDTVAPTVLYILGALLAFFALITIPKGCCGVKWFFGRKLLNLSIATATFAIVAGASSLWTYKANTAAHELATGTNEKYFKDIYLGSSFLAMTWLASVLMLVAMVLLLIELVLDRWQANHPGNNRASFIKLADTEQGGDKNPKQDVTTTAWEQNPQAPRGAEMPGYEPLRVWRGVPRMLL